MRVGIDVGGTNTDAVVMSGTEVLGKAKSPTSPDVTAGIVAALRILIADDSLDPDSVTAVMIGTTHFTNAVVEGKHLVPTAAVRLGLPATTSLPPFVDWPAGLRTTLGGHFYLCHLVERGCEVVGELMQAGFTPKTIRFVHSKEGANAFLMLIESVKGGKNPLTVLPPLFVYGADGNYSSEMQAIYERLEPDSPIDGVDE